MKTHSPARLARDERYSKEIPLGLSIRRLNFYGAFQRGVQLRGKRRSAAMRAIVSETPIEQLLNRQIRKFVRRIKQAIRLPARFMTRRPRV